MHRFHPYTGRDWSNKDIKCNENDVKISTNNSRRFLTFNNINDAGIAPDEGYVEGPEELALPELKICGVHDFGEEGYNNVGNENNHPECISECETLNTSNQKKCKTFTPLLSPVTYFLNKSKTKWVLVGLDSDSNFDPVVRIMGTRYQNVTLDEETWNEFKGAKDSINKTLNAQYYLDRRVTLKKVRVSFDRTENNRRILKASVGTDSVYLSYESLRELWKLDDVITSRLELLKSYDFAQFYYNSLNLATTFVGDLKQRLDVVFNQNVNECVMMFKELMLNRVDQVLYDFDLLQAFNV